MLVACFCGWRGQSDEQHESAGWQPKAKALKHGEENNPHADSPQLSQTGVAVEKLFFLKWAKTRLRQDDL
jgi:hypothetical protein